jgi:hypothetical protein
VEVLKRTQTQLLSVVENLSEELARMKGSMNSLQMQRQGDIESIRKWVEDSQARHCDDIQRSLNELRTETAVACRSETSARTALDEQLWLTDQRLTQRINELDKSHHETITVINRNAGEPDKVTSKHFENPSANRQDNTIHIRPPAPLVGGYTSLENDAQAVYVERTVRSPSVASPPRSPSAGRAFLEDQLSGRIRLKRTGHVSVSESPFRAGGPTAEDIVTKGINEVTERSRPSGRLRLSGTA